MKFNRLFLFALLVFLALTLSACGAAPATNWPGLSSDGKYIYLANGSHVYTGDPNTGLDVTTTVDGAVAPLRFPLQTDSKMSFYTVPAVAADGTLVVGNAASGYHALYVVDSATGTIKWLFDSTNKPWLGGALILNNTIFAPAGDGKLYAFDLTGKKLWEQNLSEHALWTSPITDGKNIYIATLSHEIFAFEPASGERLWKVELDNGIIGHPALFNGILYVGTLSGNLYALKSSDGSQIWKQTLEGNIWGTPGLDVDGKTLYIGTVFGTAGKFYTLNAEDGKVIRPPRDEEGSIIAGPLVTADQVVYVTELGHVQSLSKDGASKWVADFPKNKIYTPPLLVGDLIVVAPMGSDFLMVAYDANGVQKWKFTPAK
jgi:outer membrane protein assembly factor BamB